MAHLALREARLVTQALPLQFRCSLALAHLALREARLVNLVLPLEFRCSFALAHLALREARLVSLVLPLEFRCSLALAHLAQLLPVLGPLADPPLVSRYALALAVPVAPLTRAALADPKQQEALLVRVAPLSVWISVLALVTLMILLAPVTLVRQSRPSLDPPLLCMVALQQVPLPQRLLPSRLDH